MADKIIIKKKSGPGEITGITELYTTPYKNYNVSNVTFKEIQFTEPGDYLLTISSTNQNIDPIDINITIIPQDEIISQEETKQDQSAESKRIDGSRPIISQIDAPTIKIPRIEMTQDGTGNSGQTSYTQGLGFTPFVWYNGYQINDRDIKYLSLYHDGIIPKIKISFYDTFGFIKDSGTPQDNTTFDLFINSTSSNLKSIHCKFKIEEFIQGKPVPGQLFTIKGTIDIPDLYVITNKSYNNTSFGTIKSICKEIGIGFNSNIDDTNDKMSWRNSNRKPYEFIDEIISHSYINDGSYMLGYIDFYYCFNYVDVEKEIKRDISNDVGIDTSGMSQASNSDDSERIIRLVLTNDKGQISTSNYIESFKIRNDSTKKSLNEGYLTVTKSYDRIKKQFLIFNVDSITSDGDKNIILKGNQNDSEFFNKNVKTVFTGKLDDTNAHKNYNYAKTQNRINLFNLNKICINVVLPNINFNLYKLQKIRVDIINDTLTPTETSIINNRYSGEYIIADIEYRWNGTKMLQNLRLVKKELGKNKEEIESDIKPTNKNEIRETNYNPVVDSISIGPNNNYIIGTIYIVKDKNNNLYELTVKKLSSDGINIIGSIKNIQRKI